MAIEDGRPRALIMEQDGVNVSVLSDDSIPANLIPWEDRTLFPRDVIGTSVRDIYEACLKHASKFVGEYADKYMLISLRLQWGIHPQVASFEEFDKLLASTGGRESSLSVAS
jgi:hypothetical protein